MQLKTLLTEISGEVLNPETLTTKLLNTSIKNITLDSRNVLSNSIFVASKGADNNSKDGHDFIEQALTNQALAIIIEKKNKLNNISQTPLILVQNSRQTAAYLNEKLHKNPSHSLDVCAVTGTNGKTTVSFLTAAIMECAGKKSAVIGTLGAGKPNKLKYFGMTTPEAESLSILLKDLKKQKFTHITIEASSHGLATYRLDGIKLIAAGFTNLSADHLDFHKNMTGYKNAKNRLFNDLLPEGSPAILPEKNPLVKILRQKNHPVLTWGNNSTADVFPSNVVTTNSGIHFTLNIHKQNIKIESNILGNFNLDNMLCAAGLGFASGASIEQIASGLKNAQLPPGRMQSVFSKAAKNHAAIYVDFAHTPDALEKVLQTLKENTHGKLIVVFGCGGNRDRSKRPEMGKTANKFADLIFITSDNPRYEIPVNIMQEILQGIPQRDRDKCTLKVDRKQAIQAAINISSHEDIILIAGKGHESNQQIGKTSYPFDDAKVARLALENMK